MDVGGELRQRTLLVFRQRRRSAQPHQLPRQQNENHAQVANDRQQQAAQTFRRDTLALLGIQRPDPPGLALAIDQRLQAGRQFFRRQLQLMRQRRRQGVAVDT